MKTGFFSPMPPAPTGVADYSSALLPHLQKLGDIELNADPCDVALYHVGNNNLHREIYARALEHPGVAVIHDAVLNHFFLGRNVEAAYVDEFVYNYGAWNQSLAQELWRTRARSGTDPRYFAHPMLKRIAETSRAVIVHNPAAASVVRAHAPGGHIAEIPHLFRAPQIPDRHEARASLGIDADTRLLGTFGHQRETKRLNVVLRAFQQALDAGANAKLLVSGAFLSDAYERALAPMLDHPRILRTGYLADADFWRHAAAIDVCINLRYPTAAETSGIAVSMMGIGKAVIFTAGDEIARFPDLACLRVPVGPGEEAALAEYIRWLAEQPDAAREIGRRAAAHIAAEHAPEKVAAEYWAVLRRYN